MADAGAEPAEERLCNTSVTIRWLQSVLLEKAGRDTSSNCVKEWTATPIGVGQGFLSTLIKVHMAWGNADDALANNVVIKFPTTATLSSCLDDFTEPGSEQRKMVQLIDEIVPKVHKNECNFYNLFAVNPPLPIPAVFYTRLMAEERPGLIVMGDLSENGVNVKLYDGYRFEQLLNIAEHLAALHAYSLQNQGWANLFTVQEKDDTMSQMLKNSFNKLIEMKPGYFEGRYEKLEHCFTTDSLYGVLMSHVELGLPAVMVHGDLWCNNIMFHPDTSEENQAADQLLGIIDWQITHPGNCAEDFSRLLIACTPGDTRRKHGESVLRHYHTKLCEKLGHAPYSFDDVLKAYRSVMCFSAAFYLSGIPTLINSNVVGSDDKDIKVERLLKRAQYVLDDLVAIFGKS